MATTTTTTVGSPFAAANQALRCSLNNHLISDPMHLRLSHTKTSPHSPIVLSQLCYGTEPIISGSHKWQSLRTAAMVAFEEAVAASPDEAAITVEDEVAEQEEGGGDNDQVQVDSNTKLYFGNLPYLCDSAQLAGIVQQYGTPELVEVLYDRNSGKSRGFAFVTMSSIEDCNTVIENLDGSEYGGRYMRVNFADKPKKRETLYPETEHKLFVGNLSWSVTSESLYQAFQEYGNVVGARVLYDGETGRSRGYGFVSYATKSEMENAIASLDGVELEGRAMRVSLAEGKKS